MRIDVFFENAEKIITEIVTHPKTSDRERSRQNLRTLYGQFKSHKEADPQKNLKNIVFKLKCIFNMFSSSRLLNSRKMEYDTYEKEDIQKWLNEAKELLQQLMSGYHEHKKEEFKIEYHIFSMLRVTQQAMLSVYQYLSKSKTRISGDKDEFFISYCTNFIELNNLICSLDKLYLNSNSLLTRNARDCVDILFKGKIKNTVSPFIEMEKYKEKLFEKSDKHKIQLEKWDELIFSLEQTARKINYEIPVFIQHPIAVLASSRASKKRKQPSSLDDLLSVASTDSSLSQPVEVFRIP